MYVYSNKITQGVQLLLAAFDRRALASTWEQYSGKEHVSVLDQSAFGKKNIYIQ